MKNLINKLKGYTPEELNFLFTLKELKEVAKQLKIKGYYKMDKIVLCLNIDSIVND